MEMAIVNHFFLTPKYLIKGRVPTGGQRLTDMLRNYQRPFVLVEDITLFDLNSGTQVLADRGQLRVDDILLAHEFLDVSRDDYMRSLSDQDEPTYTMACIEFRAPSTLELVGKVRQDVMEGLGSGRFFVVQDPNMRGLGKRPEPDFERLRKLSYVIVQWSQVHCVLEYD